MAISFQIQEINFRLSEKTRLRNWIRAVIEAEKKRPGTLNFVFTSDAELLKANIHFLDHSTYTDIITFDYCVEDTVHGDILISIERVQENAQKFKVAFEDELRRVMIHGVLHLCGYKDKTRTAAALMRKKENQALEKF